MRFTIKLKLTLAFGIILMVLAGLSFYSINSLGTVNQAIGELANGPEKRLQYALQIDRNLSEIIRQQKNALLESGADGTARYMKIADDLTTTTLDLGRTGLSQASEQGRPYWAAVIENFEKFDGESVKLKDLLAAGNKQSAIEFSNVRCVLSH